MFHLAPPDVNGFGSITSTSPVTRSSQVLDALRVALADHEDDHRVGDHALVLVLVPVGVHEPGVHQPGDVRLERELDHVGRQAALDRARLLARGGVGLVEVHPLALGGLVEGRDQLLVGLLRCRVSDQSELSAAAVPGSGVAAVGVTRAAAAARDHEGEKGYEREHVRRRGSDSTFHSPLYRSSSGLKTGGTVAESPQTLLIQWGLGGFAGLVYAPA